MLGLSSFINCAVELIIMRRLFRGRRGQAAMEYLMTYGWAILVVMVVGIAMWQLGIFNMGSATLTSTGFAKLKPQLAATGIDRTGEPKAIFTNGIGTKIEITGGKVLDNNNPAISCALTPANFLPNDPAGGQNFRISAPSGCVQPGNPGDVYNALISISYDVSIGGVQTSHTDSGNLRGPFE
jgi:hypothetical protein